jgi:hypothetical protein
MEPLEYFKLLYGSLFSDAHLTLSWFVGKRCRSKRFKRENMEAFVQKALKLGERHNTFYSCAPTNLPLESTARGSNEQVTAMVAFHTDIDLLSPAARVKRDLPETVDEIKAFIHEVLPPTTAIVFTGHGVHLIYIFAAPLHITDDETRKRATELQQAFHRYVSTKASERGWKIDNCSDLARMLRFPGTMNLKDSEHPVRCEIREMDGHLYTMEELQPYLVFSDAKDAPTNSPEVKKSDREYPEALEASRIYAGCALLRDLREHPEKQTEPLWKAAIDNLCLASDGNQACHEFSSGYGGYSFEETERKIAHALHSRKPCTCDHFRTLGADCPEGGCGVKSPIVFALPTAFDLIQDLLAQDKLDPAQLLDEGKRVLLAIAMDRHPTEYALLKLKLKKAGLGSRDIERAVKQTRALLYQAKAEDDFIDEPNEIALDGLELGGMMDPPGYHVGMDGGIQSFHKEDGETITVVLCSRPVVITRIMENVDTGCERMELAFWRSGRIKHLAAQRSELLNKNSLVKYADTGLPVTSSNSEGMVMYLNAFEVANQEVIPVSRSLGRIGWLAGCKEFYPCHYQGQIVFEDADQDLVKAIGEHGDFELWKQTALQLRENPLSRAMLNATAASVLLEPLKLRIFILHSWFSSRSGKTAVLKFALSFWGDPMKMIGNFNSTAVGLERRAGMLKHLPLGIDELQQMARNLTPAMAVYQLGNGQGKTRGMKNGGLQETATWRNSIMTTGEEPLSSENSMDGVTSRAIELYGAPIDDPEFGRLVHQVSEANYGFAGRTYIRYVIDHVLSQKGKVESDYHDMRARLKEAFEAKDLGNVGVHLDSIAVMCLADLYSAQCLYGDAMLPLATVIKEVIDAGVAVLVNVKEQEKEDSIERAWSFAQGWVASNRNCFKAHSTPRYGKLEKDGVYITINILREAMEKAGYSYAKCVRGFVDRGHLKLFQDGSKKGTHQCQKKINGVNNRVVCANIEVGDVEDDCSEFLEAGEGFFARQQVG